MSPLPPLFCGFNGGQDKFWNTVSLRDVDHHINIDNRANISHDWLIRSSNEI